MSTIDTVRSNVEVLKKTVKEMNKEKNTLMNARVNKVASLTDAVYRDTLKNMLVKAGFRKVQAMEAQAVLKAVNTKESNKLSAKIDNTLMASLTTLEAGLNTEITAVEKKMVDEKTAAEQAIVTKVMATLPPVITESEKNHKDVDQLIKDKAAGKVDPKQFVQELDVLSNMVSARKDAIELFLGYKNSVSQLTRRDDDIQTFLAPKIAELKAELTLVDKTLALIEKATPKAPAPAPKKPAPTRGEKLANVAKVAVPVLAVAFGAAKALGYTLSLTAGREFVRMYTGY